MMIYPQVGSKFNSIWVILLAFTWLAKEIGIGLKSIWMYDVNWVKICKLSIWMELTSNAWVTMQLWSLSTCTSCAILTRYKIWTLRNKSNSNYTHCNIKVCCLQYYTNHIVKRARPFVIIPLHPTESTQSNVIVSSREIKKSSNHILGIELLWVMQNVHLLLVRYPFLL